MLWKTESSLPMPEIETRFSNRFEPSPITIMTELSLTVKEENTKQ
jgi:hypothetical protein